MASSSLYDQNDESDNILRPRPIKPGNPMILRALGQENGLKPTQGVESLASAVSRFVLYPKLLTSPAFSSKLKLVVGQLPFLQTPLLR